MAHSLSAQKRIRQNAKRQAYNQWRKRQYRAAIREYRELILHGSVDEAEKQLQEIYSILDRAAAKGVIHQKTAARYKSRLSARLAEKKAA